MGGQGVAYQVYVGIAVAADAFTAAWLTPGGARDAAFTGEQTSAGPAGDRPGHVRHPAHLRRPATHAHSSRWHRAPAAVS